MNHHAEQVSILGGLPLGPKSPLRYLRFHDMYLSDEEWKLALSRWGLAGGGGDGRSPLHTLTIHKFAELGNIWAINEYLRDCEESEDSDDDNPHAHLYPQFIFVRCPMEWTKRMLARTSTFEPRTPQHPGWISCSEFRHGGYHDESF